MTASLLLSLPIGKIQPDPNNPRSNLGDLTELAASIVEHGVLEPVLVRANGKGHIIVAGHRRLAAAKKAGLKEIPAIETTVDEKAAAVLQLVENLQREDLDPIDEARGLSRLKELGVAQVEIAKLISRSPGHISKRLTLAELPAEAATLVSGGKITVEDAYELARTLKVEGVKTKDLLRDVTRNPSGASWLIKGASGEAKTRIAIDEARQKLVKTGAQELAENVKGAKQVGWQFDIDKTAHRKEPCSRFTLRRGWDGKAEVEWWCSDPKRHTAKGESKLKAKKPERSTNTAWDREKKARADKTAKRVESYREIVAGFRSKPAAATAALILATSGRLILEGLYGESVDIALDLLAVEFKKSDSLESKRALIAKAFEKNQKLGSLVLVLADMENDTWRWLGKPGDFRSQFLKAIGGAK